jgi:hypothetical protein
LENNALANKQLGKLYNIKFNYLAKFTSLIEIIEFSFDLDSMPEKCHSKRNLKAKKREIKKNFILLDSRNILNR